MNYTEEQISAWKAKADLWDALDEKIAKCYVDEEGNDVDSEECDLGTVGEIAAMAFGYL